MGGETVGCHFFRSSAVSFAARLTASWGIVVLAGDEGRNAVAISSSSALQWIGKGEEAFILIQAAVFALSLSSTVPVSFGCTWKLAGDAMEEDGRWLCISALIV
nr:hypothetical protein Iba_chr08bCG11230 [Ipomoea batatas]